MFLILAPVISFHSEDKMSSTIVQWSWESKQMELIHISGGQGILSAETTGAASSVEIIIIIVAAIIIYGLFWFSFHCYFYLHYPFILQENV